MSRRIPIWILGVFAIAALAFAVAPASAADLGVKALWDSCQVLVENGILDKGMEPWDSMSPNEAADVSSCVSYITAATVSMDGYGRLDGCVAVFCAPKKPLKEAIRVFVRWGEANPERHQEFAMVGLIRALSEAWPCEDSTPEEEGGR